MKHTKPGRRRARRVVASKSGQAQRQATADKVKFNLLMDANNEVGKAFGVVYT